MTFSIYYLLLIGVSVGLLVLSIMFFRTVEQVTRDRIKSIFSNTEQGSLIITKDPDDGQQYISIEGYADSLATLKLDDSDSEYVIFKVDRR